MPDKIDQYSMKHKMNHMMCKVFAVYLNKHENISLENILIGCHGDEGEEITIFNTSKAKAKRLQDIQNKMLGF